VYVKSICAEVALVTVPEESPEKANDCDLADPGKLATNAAARSTSIFLRTLIPKAAGQIDRLRCLTARSPWQTCGGCETRFIVDGFKGSPPTGFAFSQHAGRCQRHRLAIGCVH
jgi:hypothetical protein